MSYGAPYGQQYTDPGAWAAYGCPPPTAPAAPPPAPCQPPSPFPASGGYSEYNAYGGYPGSYGGQQTDPAAYQYGYPGAWPPSGAAEGSEEPPRRRRRRRSSSGRRRDSSDEGRRHRRRRGESRRRELSPPERAALVAGKADYVRLLTEIRGWKFVKKRNIVMNVLRMLPDEERRDVIAAAQVHYPAPAPAEGAEAGPTRLSMPAAASGSDLICRVHIPESMNVDAVGRGERLPSGSCIFAVRREWGAMCLYPAGDTRMRVSTRWSSPPADLNQTGRQGQPSWEDLVSACPLLAVLFIEMQDVQVSGSDANMTVKVRSVSLPGGLKFTPSPGDVGSVAQALKGGHRQCRPFPACDSAVECYADGVEYYPRLAEAMLGAQREVLIADWWMSPYVFLKRPRRPAPGELPEPLDQNYRFDNLVQRLAFRGVRVLILLWKEVGAALALTSNHTETYLESLHPTNIRVLRHRGPLTMTHHQKFVVVDWTRVFIGGLDVCYGRYDTHEHPIFDPQLTEFVGLDYRNPMLMEETAQSQTEAPFRDTLNRAEQPRMPWHDVNLQLVGRIAYHVGLNFVQRWNHHRIESKRKDLPVLAPLVDALYEDAVTHSQLGRCQSRLVRSLGEWSGNPQLESDIHRQWLRMIDRAQHFIYIENQYFISSLLGHERVINKIAQKIAERICAAHSQGKVFRVLMVIQPHGEGDPLTNIAIRKIMLFQNQTIANMIKNVTNKMGEDEAKKYILVTSLRNWGKNASERLCTSTIYVHTKLLLVDDARLIVGSANVNDRSMVGDRDSEIGVVVDELQAQKEGKAPPEVGTIDGRSCPVGQRIRRLRLHLWREHLCGDTEDESVLAQFQDPCAPETWELIRQRAEENTKIYETVFPGIPSDRNKTLEDTQRRVSEGRASRPGDEKQLEQIKGHLCTYPVSFLSLEKKSGDMTTGITDAVSGGTMWY
eukprot:TRINITY_DN7019_c1_g1_i1.p1 TRINITY_DN7019_c1_g1~~TRINITY_DN7019_c1_g1_i1.p1  ORF type:complete len:945 (+),score=273.20 TRINITY_DN7019_c1_g1_i1:117-2951(+)